MKHLYLCMIFVYVLGNGLGYAHGLSRLSQLQEFQNINQSRIDNARQLVLTGSLKEAICEYSQAIKEEMQSRNAGRGVSGELLAEYAYALALNHDFEVALLNIDRARELGTDSGNFFVCQILLIMGYNDTANQFYSKEDKTPDWIAEKYETLNQQYATEYFSSIVNPQNALKQADKLVSANQHIQAIAIYEKLIKSYPNENIIYIGYSTLWESLGKYSYAAVQLQKGLELMKKNVGDTEREKIYSDHLLRLKAATPTDLGLKEMVYVGAIIAKDNYSVNCRAGFYTKKHFSLTMNLSIGYGNNSFNSYIGYSSYKIINCFMVGSGFGLRIINSFEPGAKTICTLDFTPSIGLTFLNKAQTSSFDITFGVNMPITKNATWGYNLSFGKTFYFNLKSKKK